MEAALAEARRGEGRTWPNPPVGAVVVRGGRIVGKGFHPRAGEPHAEVFALREAGARARGADLYVTLEPCCHHGRTPPCTEAVKAAGIRRVFAAVEDPDPRVAGGGRAALEAAGIPVEMGLGAPGAERLAGGFLTARRRGRPELWLKAALSLDGQLAPADGVSRWITGPEARARAHALRDRADAVLVGAGTVLADDPSLTVRDPAPADGRQPLRLVVDRRGRIPTHAKLVGPGTWILTGEGSTPAWRAGLEGRGARVLVLGGGELEVPGLVGRLAREGLTRILVEGGGSLLGAFLAAGAADRLFFFYAPLLLGAGGHPLAGSFVSPDLAGALAVEGGVVERLGRDWLVEGVLAARS